MLQAQNPGALTMNIWKFNRSCKRNWAVIIRAVIVIVGGYIQYQLRSKLSAMERNLKKVFHEAAQLPERDRATLAGLLIETLDPASEPDVEAAWSEEIKRRVAEIDAGTVELIPWEEVRAELFGQSDES